MKLILQKFVTLTFGALISGTRVSANFSGGLPVPSPEPVGNGQLTVHNSFLYR